MANEHRFFSQDELAQLTGWTVDRDGWLWRKTRPTDAARIAKKRSAHRMFTGNGSDNPVERGKTYCCEPYEADYLDGRALTSGAPS